MPRERCETCQTSLIITACRTVLVLVEKLATGSTDCTTTLTFGKPTAQTFNAETQSTSYCRVYGNRRLALNRERCLACSVTGEWDRAGSCGSPGARTARPPSWLLNGAWRSRTGATGQTNTVQITTASQPLTFRSNRNRVKPCHADRSMASCCRTPSALTHCRQLPPTTPPPHTRQAHTKLHIHQAHTSNTDTAPHTPNTFTKLHTPITSTKHIVHAGLSPLP